MGVFLLHLCFGVLTEIRSTHAQGLKLSFAIHVQCWLPLNFELSLCAFHSSSGFAIIPPTALGCSCMAWHLVARLKASGALGQIWRLPSENFKWIELRNKYQLKNDVLSENTVLVEDEAALQWIAISLGSMIKREQWIEKVMDPQQHGQNLSPRIQI
jgi:hypothetical protein